MTMGWDNIERQEGFAGAQLAAAREVRPILERVKLDPINPDRQKKIISRFMIAPFILFGVTFMTLDLMLPDTGWFEFLQFLLFPILFIAYMAAGVFLMRGQLAKLFVEAQARLGVKAEAMNRIAAPLGLRYVPAPGGAPKGLEWLSQQSWAPAILRGPRSASMPPAVWTTRLPSSAKAAC